MVDTVTLQLGKRGAMTFPKSLRESYRLKAGDQFTLLDLGGVFVLTPMRSQIDTLAEQITYSLLDQSETLEDMLIALREERERYDLTY